MNPERIDVKDSGEGKSYTVAGLGEVNAILHPKLTEISFESFFPGRVYPFVHLDSDGELKLPIDYVNTIKGWMESRKIACDYFIIYHHPHFVTLCMV